jgi:hypothetical protein
MMNNKKYFNKKGELELSSSPFYILIPIYYFTTFETIFEISKNVSFTKSPAN